ncbi:hypothetical protein ACFOLJ_31045 [Rugamonas sp. CCM 8940]|uniref:hypothetical protein n=1 Tax=Rugamonas sp. CCM 8940 TaxID=2765359 RepID=UPI0018F5D2AB|nr:hypothetical protein [Rugamonas sp. CCM 8940]MBJ7309209.1 hypothetical protein [Rugamonas sp. CCM 8940]
MSTQEILRGVPPDGVAELVADYRAIGATVQKIAEPDGNFTVIATFAGSPQLAPLATADEAEAAPAPTAALVEELPPPLPAGPFATLAAQYRACFDLCQIRPQRQTEIKGRVGRLLDNAPRYRALANDVKIPWYFIGIIHMLESNTNFATHLHNGDPLSARTSHVPRGRPAAGNPPFNWEDSALDALTLEGFVGLGDWNVATMLYRWEKFNGFGYRAKELWSPYVWSYSNLYEKGRFVEDHRFDPDSVSQQCGAGVLLKALQTVL